jgi:hypothetical protein
MKLSDNNDINWSISLVVVFGCWRAFLADTNTFAFSINCSAVNSSFAEVEKEKIRGMNIKVNFFTELSLYA